jgi:uridine phosphorylase
MTVPRFEQKWPLASSYTPGLFLDSLTANGWQPGIVPDSVIFTYGRFELYLTTQTEHFTPNHMLGTGPGRFFLVDATDHRVAVNCLGVGAPATAAQLELQAELGVQQFMILGTAGGLSTQLSTGDIVVPTEAVRDDGTSDHYAAPDVEAVPDPTLTDGYVHHLAEHGHTVTQGSTWTTAAPFRTTPEEVAHYAAHGVQTVEEEVASLFIVGAHRNVATAAALVVDGIADGSGAWEIDLATAARVLQQLLPSTIDYLATI